MGKRIAFINAVPYGSTGKIVRGIAEVAEEKGHEVLIYYSWTKNLKKSNDPKVVVGSFVDKIIHMILSKVTGLNGCFGAFDTMRLIRKLKKFKPDVINLHILHSWSVNLPMLFKYLKKSNAKVVWTMHDCWAFTGQCPHFIMAKCDKWKTGCFGCPSYRQYPAAYVDQTKLMWKLKKKWFTGVKDLTVVTPSKWLASLIKESFLGDYPVEVINNGIDLSIFKPTESDFRKKYNCEDKTVLLGVAFDWGKRKGLDVFKELNKHLPSVYQMVFVGTDDNIDTELPEGAISIHRTQNQAELAEVYSAADVFLNPTREDTFPTVNMEALACGTPVVTFRTGGSPEILDENCGVVVDCDDVDAFEDAVVKVSSRAIVMKDACLERASNYDMHKKFAEYLTVLDI